MYRNPAARLWRVDVPRLGRGPGGLRTGLGTNSRRRLRAQVGAFGPRPGAGALPAAAVDAAGVEWFAPGEAVSTRYNNKLFSAADGSLKLMSDSTSNGVDAYGAYESYLGAEHADPSPRKTAAAKRKRQRDSQQSGAPAGKKRRTADS